MKLVAEKAFLPGPFSDLGNILAIRVSYIANNTEPLIDAKTRDEEDLLRWIHGSGID
jgi:hypothetical protein